MAKARYFSADGDKTSEIELSSKIFEVEVNAPVMHEVVRAQLSAARAGTHSTKTRAEVRGGGRKPWRQKGTGRARHGSIREPQWVGGGVAHGPKPRDHSLRINKKVRALALRSALTDRAKEGNLLIVDLPEFEEPETKKASTLLGKWGVTGKVLLVVGAETEEQVSKAVLSFRNIPEVLCVTYPTTYTVLAADVVVFTKDALDAFSKEPETSPKGAKKPQNSGASTSPVSASPKGAKERLDSGDSTSPGTPGAGGQASRRFSEPEDSDSDAQLEAEEGDAQLGAEEGAATSAEGDEG